MENRINGAWGWFGLAAWIAIWDASRRTQTMSEAWYLAWTGKTKGRVFTLALWVATTQHLFRPMSHDMYNLIGKAFAKLTR